MKVFIVFKRVDIRRGSVSIIVNIYASRVSAQQEAHMLNEEQQEEGHSVREWEVLP